MRIGIVIERTEATRLGELERVEVSGDFGTTEQAYLLLRKALTAMTSTKLQGEVK